MESLISGLKPWPRAHKTRVITISNKSLFNKLQFPVGASSGWEGMRFKVREGHPEQMSQERQS